MSMSLGATTSLVVQVILGGLSNVLAYNVQILHRIELDELYGEKNRVNSEDHQRVPSIRIYYPGEPEVPEVQENEDASLDTWSVIWYLASFGGLIIFFLIVSCSEWCCRRNARRNFSRTSNIQPAPPRVPDTPPPSYAQFAPPDYESTCFKVPGTSSSEKSEYDIYVVPVHALGTIMETARTEDESYRSGDAPPSYQSAFEGTPQVPSGRTNSSSIHLDPINLPSVRDSSSQSHISSSNGESVQISIPHNHENIPT